MALFYIYRAGRIGGAFVFTGQKIEAANAYLACRKAAHGAVRNIYLRNSGHRPAVYASLDSLSFFTAFTESPETAGRVYTGGRTWLDSTARFNEHALPAYSRAVFNPLMMIPEIEHFC